jgi:Ser/Thr protein kinase RdoA (MazF antagonist)
MTRTVNPTPDLGYSHLTPAGILGLLAAVGLHGDGRILQLNSYENRVYQVYLEDGSAVVAKFYRPGRWSDAQILEEHAFSLELVAAEIPVVAPCALARDDPCATLVGDPPTLAHGSIDGSDYRFAVTPCRSGRAPELDDPETLRWIGRFLGRLHVVGARRAFVHRVTLDVATFGDAARQAILASDRLPADLRSAWAATCDAALDAVRECLARGPKSILRLHGDCHRGNLLWSQDGPHFVDLDDSCNGPAIQDLWMLLAGDRATMRGQLAELVVGYEAFRHFDWREASLIEPLRTLRMIHHSAWIAKRWHDPAFPLAFPWFGSPSYWSQQIADLRDQLDLMRDDAD